jgi:hypothetical protein
LKEVPGADAKAIGNYLIRLYRAWKPKSNAENPRELGELYGFKLYIRHEKELGSLDGKLFNNEFNSLYAEKPDGSIRYTFSSGAPNADNPKLAARYFLNAIDKVDGLVEKYRNGLRDLDGQVPQLKAMLDKPFEKKAELGQMKSELSRLEREIAQKIQEKQQAQQQPDVEQLAVNQGADEEKNTIGDPEARVITLKQTGTPIPERPVVNGREPDFSPQLQQAQQLKKAKGVRL